MSTPESLHTPTPWYESGTGNHQGLIIEERTGRNVSVTYDKADAAFIVRAVNSHDALMAALADILEIAKSRWRALPVDSPEKVRINAALAALAQGEL